MLIRGDARSIPLRDASIDTVVTSPPYFGLRDYGHAGQIGLESAPDAFVSSLVDVFREVRRVLKPQGTAWLNLGDSYCGGGGFAPDAPVNVARRADISNGIMKSGSFNLSPRQHTRNTKGTIRPDGYLKSKDLVGIPWRVAFALQADGWYLRSDIIWHKPNPMPESVTDRPTRAHEYLFLLAKSERYYYDADAIAEALSVESLERYGRVERNGEYFDPSRHKHGDSLMHNAPMQVLTRAAKNVVEKGSRNKRSVWTVTTEPYSGAHFATFPEALIEPCILAGCPQGGIVLDPFVGSGTTVAVAKRLSRRGVGLDLAYQDLARMRTAQGGLMFAEERG